MIILKGGILVNSVMLVGRLTRDLEVKKLESGKEVTNLLLAVSRGYRNAEGNYETDFIDCVLWDGMAKNTSEFCKKGDMVVVRGRIQTSYYVKDEITRKATDVVVEKISFLGEKRNEVIEVG